MPARVGMCFAGAKLPTALGTNREHPHNANTALYRGTASASPSQEGVPPLCSRLRRTAHKLEALESVGFGADATLPPNSAVAGLCNCARAGPTALFRPQRAGYDGEGGRSRYMADLDCCFKVEGAAPSRAYVRRFGRPTAGCLRRIITLLTQPRAPPSPGAARTG